MGQKNAARALNIVARNVSMLEKIEMLEEGVEFTTEGDERC